MTHNIIYTPRKTSLSETGSRSLTSELSVQRPEGASYGGSQTWFSSPSIRGYGCGLIAAHDLLWYLERKESLTAQTDRHRSGEQLVSDFRSWEDYERSVKRLHRLFPILPRLGINGLMLSRTESGLLTPPSSLPCLLAYRVSEYRKGDQPAA